MRRGLYLALLFLLLGLVALARWGAGSREGKVGAPPAVTGVEELEPVRGLGGCAAAPAPLDPSSPSPASTLLAPEQALVAAAAARQAGDRSGEEAMLVAALGGGDLTQVAGVELAELVVEAEPGRAASLLLPVLLSPRSRELQGVAVDLVSRALTADPAAVGESDLRRVGATLPRSAARRLELAAAGGDPEQQRQGFDRLLRESADDLVALDAAEGLAGLGELDGIERWRAARAFFQHGRYSEALRLLTGLGERGVDGVPGWELAFTVGRAWFRLGAWDEAASMYRGAVAAADTSERRAMLEVHRSRALELGGKLDEAVDAARRAVAAKTTDERRLHLLRLRLRQGRLDLAAEGQRRLRGGSASAEGALRLAMHELAAGRHENARRQLGALRSRPWGAPAAVIRARLTADRGEWAEVAAVLDGSVDLLDPFWGAAARQVMASLPAAERLEWRRLCRRRLDEGGSGGDRRRALQSWAVLESEAEALAELRREVAAVDRLELGREGPPAFTSPLATRLWSLGLRRQVGRFDPGAFPARTAAEAVQSARSLLELGRTRQAIRLAESASRQAFPRFPARVLPAEVRAVLYPLPWPELVAEAAAACGVEAPLLAGLVREESRWEATAVSAVGARGLTQLMPATAVASSSRLGWLPPAPGSLFEPRVALHLGATELARLVDAFGGHRAAAVAGYNAGEAQARLWFEQCGPGCTDERLVAAVTFAATRGYVAEVLASSGEYRELYPALASPAGGAGPQRAAEGETGR